MPRHSQTRTDKLAAAMSTKKNRINVPRGSRGGGVMHKKELVMNKPHTHMLDVAAESSINSLLIHTVAWLENTCNNSYNGFLKRQVTFAYKVQNNKRCFC